MSVISGLSQASATKSAAKTQAASADASIAEQQRQFDYAMSIMQPFRNAGTSAIGPLKNYIGLNADGSFTPQSLNVQVPKEYQALFDTQYRKTGEQLDRDAAAMHLSGTPFLKTKSQSLSDLLGEQSATGYNAGLNRAMMERNMNYGALADLMNVGEGNALTGAGLAVNTGQNIGNTLMDAGNNSAAAQLAMGRIPGQVSQNAMNAYGMYNMFNRPAQTQNYNTGYSGWGYGDTGTGYGANNNMSFADYAYSVD